MTVSVIIPCYNLGGRIGRCLDSVLAQEYKDLEIIVIDDGSTDGSGGICDSYAGKDARIRVIHQENAGLGPARNTGIEASAGEILAFVDGDDWIFPGMIRVMAEAMEKSGADMSVCRYSQVSDGEDMVHVEGRAGRTDGTVPMQDGITGRLFMRDEALYALVAEDEATVIQNAAWNKLYRRKLFFQDNGSEILRYPAHRYEDIVITAKLIARCEKVIYIDEPLYAYVSDRGGSIMNKSKLPDLLREQIPSYWERDEFFVSIGKKELADVHDYIVGKKLLELHTAGRRSGEKEAVRELDGVIRSRYKERFSEIYDSGLPVVDPHHRLRMRLFLMHPAMYDIFTSVNEGVVMPVRRGWTKKNSK